MGVQHVSRCHSTRDQSSRSAKRTVLCHDQDCAYDHVFLLPIVIYSITAWGRIYQYADGGSLPHTSFNTFYSFSMQHTGALFRGIPVYFFFSLDLDVSLTRRRVWLRETVSASVIFQQHSVYVRTSLCGSLIKAQQWVLIKRIGLL